VLALALSWALGATRAFLLIEIRLAVLSSIPPADLEIRAGAPQARENLAFWGLKSKKLRAGGSSISPSTLEIRAGASTPRFLKLDALL